MAKDSAPISGPGGIGSADTHVIQYRPDIDGLRAVAVWSVVLFHMFRTLAPAGYLGVDMFFVLSGYLITSIIWKEVNSGAFKISKFYDRRIRRIMPALLVLLAVVTVVAVLIMLPADLIGYGKSVLATLGFVANIYFWRDTDYFARVAETKPLLHLWSLGVEEQFYVAFPVVLWLIARFKRAAAMPCMVLLVVGSLALDIALRHAGGSGPAFFLLPTRGWELGVGALVAVTPESFRMRGPAAQGSSILGAVLIIVGLFGLLPLTVLALSPAVTVVFGTGLMILAGRHDLPAPSRVLALKPLVFFGWISYSLYLWHWPIIVLGQYYLVRDFSAVESVAAMALMVVLATASWRFVERPFREKSMPIAKVRWSAAIGALVLGVAGIVLIAAHGLPKRLNAAAATINAAVDTHYRCAVLDLLPFGSSRACVMNLPSRMPADADVVLLGNSHAQMYAPAWRAIIAEHGQKGLLVPLNGCLPTLTVNISQSCVPAAQQNLTSILALPKVTTVVLGLTWTYPRSGVLMDPQGRMVDNLNDMALAAGIDDLIARLKAAGKRVVLIGPIAEPGYDIASDLGRTLAFNRRVTEPTFLPLSQFNAEFGPIIAHLAARQDVVFVRPDLVQCAAGRCDYVIGGHALFSDSNHLAQSSLPMLMPGFRAAYAASQERH
ncbi:MAG: acyltransferase family protein [Caulobacteraceae bacterium]